jgi:hypothetical protein
MIDLKLFGLITKDASYLCFFQTSNSEFLEPPKKYKNSPSLCGGELNP